MRAVFRVDASARAGTGHAMRCLVLADALQAMGMHCSFVAAGPDPELAATFAAAAHPLLLIEASAGQDPVDDARAFLGRLPPDADWAIVDHYRLDARWESTVRPHVRRLLVIDDLADRAHDCDLLLDPGPGRTAADYLPQVPAHARLLLGPSHALLRPAFATRHASAPRWPQVRRAHVFVGGGGHLQALPLLCSALLEIDGDVVLAAAGAADPSAMSALASAFPGRVDWQPRVADMAAHMAACSVAVGSPGGATWERACLGLPSALLATAANQQPVLQVLASLGLCADLGPVAAATPAGLRSALRTFLGDAGGLAAMRERMVHAVDGRGAARVAAIVAGLSDEAGLHAGAVAR